MNVVIKDDRGSITVWMTLVLVCIYTLALVLIWGLNNNYTTSFVDKITIVATKSIMSEYDKDIYEHYGVYVFDRGYGTATRSGNISKKFKEYVRISSDVKYKSGIMNNTTLNGSNGIRASISVTKLYFEDGINNNPTKLRDYSSAYMKKILNTTQLNNLKAKDCYRGYSEDDILLVEYLIEKFSSYKQVTHNNELNKKNIYEVEFLISNKLNDNDCLEDIINMLGMDSDTLEMCSESEYTDKLRVLLINFNKELLCRRAWRMIVSNINETYDKAIERSNCFCTLSTECTYNLNNGFGSIKLIKSIVSKGAKSYCSKYKYSYK